MEAYVIFATLFALNLLAALDRKNLIWIRGLALLGVLLTPEIVWDHLTGGMWFWPEWAAWAVALPWMTCTVLGGGLGLCYRVKRYFYGKGAC